MTSRFWEVENLLMRLTEARELLRHSRLEVPKEQRGFKRVHADGELEKPKGKAEAPHTIGTDGQRGFKPEKAAGEVERDNGRIETPRTKDTKWLEGFCR